MNVFLFFSPKRYLLADLVDWFYKLMRKDEKWGYRRIDMKYDLFMPIKVALVNAASPSYPWGNLHWESLERVSLIFILKIEENVT